MPFFDECCVLIPASTLEDFPSDLSDSEARSLLAGWTVLWHPALLAAAEQIPAWYRADAPPDPIGRRLVTVASPCQSLLPEGLEQRSRNQPDCCWVSGEDRASMLAEMAGQLDALREQASDEEHPAHGVDTRLGQPWPELQGNDRTIGVEDFYAAAFVALQVQVMTRRLRYTSNLDEIHLQTRLIAAATAFVEGNGQAAIEALHDVFDSLAEERDHYFSSDPHLVDLTLAVPSTVESLLDAVHPSEDESATHPTPTNVLIDADTAEAIAASEHPGRETFCRSLAEGRLGWAGGGPNGEVCLDTMTLAESEAVFVDAWQRTSDAIGQSPWVYGRFSGTTPGDMTRTLASLGYRGVIPLDFSRGSGYGDEAKVILQASGVELEALTAKPIDAASDAAFLTLGIKLGEAIDSGEIATALLAHWPGQSCDAFKDVRRAASWSLVLGRFWKLNDYFTEGEHPYHHGTTESSSADAHQIIEELVQQRIPNPISDLATAFRAKVINEQQRVLAGMTSLVTGEQTNVEEAGRAFAVATGSKLAGADAENAQALLAINPHATGVRHQLSVHGGAPREAKHLFAASNEGPRCDATIDIPGCGFVIVRATQPPRQSGMGGLLRSKLFGGSKAIAEADGLKNEFMEVAINENSGGIAGVYSGAGRGNRLSMRLVRQRVGLEKDDETVMKCEHFSTTNRGDAAGRIETSGSIEDAKSGATLASFRLGYELQRGSRFLSIDGEITPASPITGSPWHEYIAARVAVATETPICHTLVRDKQHRARGRRIVSPLGIVIDESERQTLISGQGLAFHRRADERFVDTLLQVEGEQRHQFTLAYGFDVPSPVVATRALIFPPQEIPVEKEPSTSEIGWVVHASSKDLLITTLDVARRSDGKLAAIVRVVQTRPQALKATLRFFRDIDFAVAVEGTSQSALEAAPPEDEADPRSLATQGDSVTVPIGGHGVADLLVAFTEG